jgi:hypothetical protein
MPREAAHIAVANRNEATIQHLLADKAAHAEWIATVAFYRALHIAEAMLAGKGKHGQDHGDRAFELKRNFAPMWYAYRVLWSMSTIARYIREPNDARPGTDFTTFTDYLNGQDVELVVLVNCLRVFEKEAKAKLSPASAAALHIA